MIVLQYRRSPQYVFWDIMVVAQTERGGELVIRKLAGTQDDPPGSPQVNPSWKQDKKRR